MTFKKMNDFLSEFPQLSIEDSILGLHEAATKLWLASGQKDKEEIAKRLANVIIGVSFAAKTLEIDDLDRALEKRMLEFQNEIK